MDYEEAYKKALERAREELGSGCYNKGTIEYIFPELKAEDERIREQIISFIEEYGNPAHCEWQKDWIAWLEKQGERETDEWKEGAKWADRTMIEKACEWLETTNLDYYQIIEGVFSTDLVKDFRKAMEE